MQPAETYNHSGFVTEGGKHIDYFPVEGSSMLTVGFREGGELPKEFQQKFTSMTIANEWIDKYLRRMAGEEVPALREPQGIDPETAFTKAVKVVEEAIAEDPLPDVLEKVEGEGLIDGQPREGYKYGSGEHKGKIVKKVN